MEVLPTIKNAYETAKDMGHFVLDRLIGGAWGELANQVKEQK